MTSRRRRTSAWLPIWLFAVQVSGSQLLYVTDDYANTIHRFLLDGTDLGVFANSGLDFPVGMTFDGSGNLFVANFGNSTIRKFGSDGTDLGNFATTGLDHPFGITFGPDGNIYTSNFGNNTIRRFSPTGSDLGNFVTVNLGNPTGLTFDSSGNLYVANADPSTYSVSRYDSSGNSLGLFATANLSEPYDLDFDSSGNLFVSNHLDGKIQQYASDGTPLGAFGLVLSHPQGVEFDQGGNLLVASYDSSAVTTGIYSFSSGGALNQVIGTTMNNPEFLELVDATLVPESTVGPGGVCVLLGLPLVISIFRKSLRGAPAAGSSDRNSQS